MDLSIILTQMGILVFIIAVGFCCARLKVTGQEFTHSVAGVAINVLMSFTIISSVMGSELSVSLAEMGKTILLMFIIIVTSCLAGFILSKTLKLESRRAAVTFVAVGFMNTVFVGYPVVESIYGAEGVFFASLSNIPFNIIIYSLGTAVLSGEGKKSVSVKNMLSPPMVATLIAILIMLTGVKVPEFLSTACATIGKATTPMSMLVIGTSLGLAPLKSVLGNWRVYIITFVRLIICPILVWAAARLFVTNEVVLGVMVILSATPTGMIITPLSIQYGADELFASECVFMSTLFCAVTMPLMILLLL